MVRQLVCVWVTVLLLGSQLLRAASFPVVNSVAELQALWDAAWEPTGPIDRLPPGTGACCRLLGPVVYSPSLEEDFLDALPTRSQAGAIWRPLQVRETVTEPRHRICLNAHEVVIRTNDVPSGYDWMQAVRLGHGDPPAWLPDMEREAWWAARDPARQQVGCDLVSAASLPAYLAMLTAGVVRVGSGLTNASLSDLYSNELAFVSVERADMGMQVRIHAPGGAERLELFRTSDPRDSRAWVLSALIEHAVDPEIALVQIGDAGFVWAASEAGRDSDGDGLSDAREVLLHGTGTQTTDSDGDGLADGEEVWRWGLDATNPDTDGDWVADGMEVAQGYSPADPGDGPAPGFALEGGALYTRSTNLVLRFDGLDAVAVALGESLVGPFARTATFATTIPFALADASNGLRTVYAQLRRPGQTDQVMAAQCVLDTSAPQLVVTSPVEGAVTAARWITVAGQVSDAADSVTILVNDQWVDGVVDGSFRLVRFPLVPGTNRIRVTAMDVAGNSATQTVSVVLDATGDDQAPQVELDLPYDEVVAGAQTSVLATTTLPAEERLFVRARCDDEAAALHCAVLADGGERTPGDVVQAGPDAWLSMPLAPGTNRLLVWAVDAAGNTGQLERIAIRDTNLLFVITNPLPYQIVGDTGVIVEGRADARFAGAEITVNGVACEVMPDGADVLFRTRVPVPLAGPFTALRGHAVVSGRTYICDPVAASYVIRAWRAAQVRFEQESLDTCGAYVWSLTRNPYIPPHTRRTSATLTSEQHWDADSAVRTVDEESLATEDDLTVDVGGHLQVIHLVTTNAAHEAYPEPGAPGGLRMGTEREVSEFRNNCGRHEQSLCDTRSDRLSFRLVSATQCTESVLFRFFDFDHGRRPGMPICPSNITFRGQRGFWLGGNVAFVVPLEMNREYTISASDFTWPDFAYPNGARGTHSGHWLSFSGFTNSVVTMNLVPDWNHDREVSAADAEQASVGGPFRFWINDDDDAGDVANEDTPGQNLWGASKADHGDFWVNGRCDLLDYFPVWLDLSRPLAAFSPSDGFEYRLRHADGAVNAVYSDLLRAQAGRFLIAETNAFGPDLNRAAHEARKFAIPAGGALLHTNFLSRITADGRKGVLLLEGAAGSAAPLTLEVRKDGQTIFQREMPLSLSGVEAMYRKVNLRNMTNPGALPEPANFPDRLCSDKNLVFLHGYQPDVGESGDMSAWLAEMFKRHYQSGSRAKFHGVLWYSNQGDPMDYQRSVTNAFQTAPILKSYVQGLSGPVVVEAHSLGNMVVSSALADHQMSVDKYMMCNAAVASEAYDQAAPQTNSLVGEWWDDYDDRTWAANWYRLFAGMRDARTNLTWRGRFRRMVLQADVYNFYSDGDEVFDLTPTLGLMTGALGVDADWVFVLPVNIVVNVNFGRYSWQKQELFKGTRYSNGWSSFGGTPDAGWGFAAEMVYISRGGVDAWVLVTQYTNAAGANSASDESLREYPVFKHEPDWLIGSNTLSQTKVDHLLSMGVPALSSAAGRTAIRAILIPADRQLNLNSVDFKPNGWPSVGHVLIDAGKWLHNDMKDVSYFHNYRFFDMMATEGQIR